MLKSTYYCDGCGVEKKDSNHWFGVKFLPRGTILGVLEVCSFMDSGPGHQHLCGESCLGKRLAQFAAELREGSGKVDEARVVDEFDLGSVGV